jgi:hypothetical protein
VHLGAPGVLGEQTRGHCLTRLRFDPDGSFDAVMPVPAPDLTNVFRTPRSLYTTDMYEEHAAPEVSSSAAATSPQLRREISADAPAWRDGCCTSSTREEEAQTIRVSAVTSDQGSCVLHMDPVFREAAWLRARETAEGSFNE